MTKGDAWMPLYPGDYLRDTGHLSTTEHGAYLLLIMQAWTRDGELPADEERLRNLARLDAKEWRKSRAALLAFFYTSGDTLRHRRVDREIERAQGNIAQRSAAGKASAEARKRQREGNGRSTSVATGGPTEALRNGRTLPSPSPLQKEEEITATPISLATLAPPPPAAARAPAKLSGFAEFWTYWPRKVAKGEAEKAWPSAVQAAGGDPFLIIDGLKCRLHIPALFDPKDEGRFIPYPATWLRRRGWEDAIPGVEPDDDNPALPFH